MGSRARRALHGAGTAAALAALLAACGQALLTAPAGSHLHVTANPPFITAHGGVSVISVLVVEPPGTVVPDGTVVQFFTSLGTIDEQGKTNDGVARVNLVSDSNSGLAIVTAVSGGPAPASPAPSSSPTASPTASPSASPTAPPTATPSPSPGVTPTPTPRPSATIRPGVSAAPLGEADGEGSASVTVAIGGTQPLRVLVDAEPGRVTLPRQSRITATVLDKDGNPVANVPVFFSIVNPVGTETLDSGGRPAFTDTNGQVGDVLRTTAPTTAAPRLVAVRALTANGVEGFFTLTIN